MCWFEYAVFFVVDFFMGDMASDLGQLLALFPFAFGGVLYYLSVCDLLKFRPAPGFFFRASHHHKNVVSIPFVGSAVNNRCRGYLVQVKLFEGEHLPPPPPPPHSFGVGLSNTL